MKISNQVKKFDRKYLFLEYNLTNFLPSQRKYNRNITNQIYVKVRTKKFYVDSTNKNLKISKKNLNLKSLSSYLQFVESTIEKDFMLLQHIWTFFKIYSKPTLFKLFPNRRSFFCYLIFPFVGFITISNFNSSIQKHSLLMQSNIESLSPKNLVENSLTLNWNKIEYLNYKKLFFQKNTLNRKVSQLLIPIKNNTLAILANETETFLINSNKINNFDRKQTQNIINNCTVYLNEAAKAIYTSKVAIDLLNRINEDDTKFTTKTVDYMFKVNNLTETLLGNQFHSNSILESYWYGLHLLKINKNEIFKNLNTEISDLYFQKSQNKNMTQKWQLDQNFPDKLLAINSDKFLVTNFHLINSINKSVEKNKQKINMFSDRKTVTLNFEDMINVNFKETDLISNLVKQFKNKLNLSQTTHPIFFYEKAHILLNNLIEKFEIDFSLDLKLENLQHLLSNQKTLKSFIKQESYYKLDNTDKLDSNFLHYLNKLLISSKFFGQFYSSVYLEKISPCLGQKYNPKFKTYDLDEEKKVNIEFKKLTNKETFCNNINIGLRKKLNLNYYLLIKKNLRSILLKKLFLNFPINKTIKSLSWTNTKLLSKIMDTYHTKKKFLKHETTELSNIKILIDKSNLLTYFLTASKPKIKKKFLLSKLNLKVNKHFQLMLNQLVHNPKQSLYFPDFISSSDNTSHLESYFPTLVYTSRQWKGRKELEPSSLIIRTKNLFFSPKSTKVLKTFFSSNNNNKPKNIFRNLNKKSTNLLLTLVLSSSNYSISNQFSSLELQSHKINNSSFPSLALSETMMQVPKYEGIKTKSIKTLNQSKIIRPKHNAIYFSYDPVLLEKTIFRKNIDTKLIDSNTVNNKLLNSLSSLNYGNKKTKFLVNNLHINQNLLKNVTLEKILKNYFLVKTNQSNKIVSNSFFHSNQLNPKSKEFKNHIIWSKLKINNLNYFAKQIFDTHEIRPEFFVNTTQKNIITKFSNQKYFNTFDNIKQSFFRNHANQSYYVNKIDKNNLKNLASHFYSKQSINFDQTDLLKLNSANSIFNFL
jgi:hypothetical protein